MNISCIFCYCFVCLCCVVSVHYRLCLVTVCMRVLQNGRCVRFSKVTDCWCAFSWSICNQNDNFIRWAVSKILKSYTNYEKTVAKRNSGWKPKLSERDCHTLKRIVTENENYCSKGDNRTEYLPWRPSFQRNSPTRTTNSTSMVELQSLNP